jgi:NADP-dependent 3-hydroxy acid dehydrogenase YdfG
MTTLPILQGKVALVTGAGSGISRATALCLSQAGARVVVAELQSTAGDETAAFIREQTGNDVLSVQCNVSQSKRIEAAVQAAVDKFGSLDIAVNNAGMHPDSAPIESLDEDYWNRLIAVNLTGVALSMKWELRQMIAQGRGGSIVNMASGTVFRARKGIAAYVAAKHGVVGLTQVAALENGDGGHGSIRGKCNLAHQSVQALCSASRGWPGGCLDGVGWGCLYDWDNASIRCWHVDHVKGCVIPALHISSSLANFSSPLESRTTSPKLWLALL